jgi:hypothetical protein
LLTRISCKTKILQLEFDVAKNRAASHWPTVLWPRRRGRSRSPVLDEVYVVAMRMLKPAVPEGDARAEVRRDQCGQPWLVGHAGVGTGWGIEARLHVHYGDALMRTAAQHQGCRLMLTEDLQHGQAVNGIRIVNPFVPDPEILDLPP